MHPALATIFARLEHGDGLLAVLIEAIGDYAGQTSGPPALQQTYDPVAKTLTLSMTAVQPPLRLGLMVGDVLHAWRSSLDNLVECMLERNSWPPTVRHQFPIESVNNGKARKNLTEQTRGIRSSDRTAIDAIQPFTFREDADGHPLAALRDLSNYDKHHVILPTVHSYAMQIKLPGSDQWIPVTDARLAFRPGVETPINFWLQEVIGAEMETFDLRGPNPGHELLVLKLNNVTDAEPRAQTGEIPIEYAFWSPNNAATLTRLEQIRDVLRAFLQETSERWISEDQSATA
jgi:hypothetical protein